MMHLLKNIYFATAHSIRGKIILNIILIHAILMIFIVFDMINREQTTLKEHLKEQAIYIAKTASVSSPLWLLTNDLVALNELVRGYKDIKNLSNIIILDKYGRVRASFSADFFNKTLIDEYSIEALKSLKNVNIYQKWHTNVLDVAMPVLANGNLVGYVRVLIDKSELENRLYSSTVEGILYVLIAIFVGAIVAYIYIAGMTRRLNYLISIANSVTHGDYNIEIKSIKGKDEINTLLEAFEIMIKTVKDKITELSDLNNNLEIMVKDEIEKRRDKEKMLIQQSKMASMGEMLNAIAHQWRQPLNSIGLVLQNIEDSFEYGDLDATYLHTNVENGLKQLDYMSQTIDDFREFFKPDKKSMDFSVKSAIEETFGLLSTQLKNHSINFDIIGDDLIIKNSHPNEFKQAILNIINNSKDAIIKKQEESFFEGFIIVELVNIDGLFRIIIKDNGGGVTEEIAERIFEPYFTTKFKSQGTGIGLYMTKVIIEKNLGGFVYFKNSDVGANFFVEFKES